MIKSALARLPLVLFLGAVVSAGSLGGCAASRPLAPFPAGGSGPVSSGVADALILAVNQTRANGREVGGWCWSDARTGELTGVVRGGIGDEVGIGIELPVGGRGDQRLSCSWHTHAWDPRAIPGPSRRDLANSRLPQLRGMPHFVLDRQGIWQYADGRVLVMCPWNGAGTNFDAGRCRS
jgi:hypothetical protein